MVTKEKKLAQVGELIEKLGLTGKEVVNYLNNLPQMNNIDISQIQVGMFWYEDDTFSFQRMVDKRIKAIVEWIGNSTIYGDLTASEIFDIKEECLNWFDAKNYMDFMAAQMYIANIDIDNIRFFKTDSLKWTWLFYDTDLSFSSSDYDTVKDYTNPGGTGGGNALSTELINALLKNPEFRDAFIRRIAWQLENIWSVENVTARVNEIENLIAEDMKRDCEKWGRSYTGWQGSVDFLRKFPEKRNEKLPAFVQSYFALTDQQMREYGFSVGG